MHKATCSGVSPSLVSSNEHLYNGHGCSWSRGGDPTSARPDMPPPALRILQQEAVAAACTSRAKEKADRLGHANVPAQTFAAERTQVTPEWKKLGALQSRMWEMCGVSPRVTSAAAGKGTQSRGAALCPCTLHTYVWCVMCVPCVPVTQFITSNHLLDSCLLLARARPAQP